VAAGKGLRGTRANQEVTVILKIDRLAIELPMAKEPDPDGAAAVQELLGGRFGEMSTFMNYTFQSFNFRGREKAKPYYDLVSNIGAEEYGHIELVSAAINAMLTGASEDGAVNGDVGTPLSGVKSARNSHHYTSSAARARSLRTRWASRGRATTSSTQGTSSSICCTISSSSVAPARRRSASTR
jgi:Mn-containing catalase